ncbi:MAG: hypothetical protein KKH28_03895 [Elusimicrobia bacterium]|nr:hypothetical protein [Elusimicrobiota bacterium]
MKTLKLLIKKFWIRKDREPYFLHGFIIACFIACFVSSYWHFLDRTAVKPNIRMTKKAVSREDEIKKLKESRFYTPKPGGKATKYYKMEEKSALPTIPDLPEDYGDNN